jgi:hypothetical protein
MNAYTKLQNLTDHFRAIEDDSELRMDCLLVLASADDNAGATLGWEETEAFFDFSLRSVSDILSDESPEVQAAFKAVGVTF